MAKVAKSGQGGKKSGGSKRRSPLDDMRREIRAVVSLKFEAYFDGAPKRIGAELAPVVAALGNVYGETPAGVRFDQDALSRTAMEELVEHLGRGRYGPDFVLAPSQVASGPLIAHLKKDPRVDLAVALSHGSGMDGDVYELDWSFYELRDRSRLRVTLSLGWVLKGRTTQYRSLVDRLFALAARCGARAAHATPIYALRQVFYDKPGPIERGWSWSTVTEPIDAAFTEDVAIAGVLKGSSWRLLLGPWHVQAIGGPEKLKGELARTELCLDDTLVRPLADGYFDLECSPDPYERNATLWMREFVESRFFWQIRAARLNAFLARYGLLTWQMPCLLEALCPDLPNESATPTSPKARAFKDTAAYMAHLWAHPPRSIREVAVKPKAHELKWVAKHIGTHVTAFIVGPKEGDMLHPIWTKSPKGTTVRMKSPILVGGPTRSSAHFVFDKEKDGWEGQQNDRPPAPLQGMVPFACPDCGHDKFRALAIFWYDDEDEWVDEPEMLSHVEDYFHWFTLRVTCGRCKLAMEGASIECA